jgi:asparagine synthase (glutamine-hydrolysing)
MAGIIRIGTVEERNLDQMMACLKHEGSLQYDTYINSEIGLNISWLWDNEFPIKHAPIWNQERNVCMIFVGEDFMDASEWQEFSRNAKYVEPERPFYLIDLYEKRGLKFIEKMNGWFSGVLMDLRQQKIVLFNDRYGLNRVYYHENSQGFFFATEAKSLLSLLPELRRLDPQGVAETFSCGCVLQNRTLFPGISLLPGASRWIFHADGKIDKGRYFGPDCWENQPQLSVHEYGEAIRDTFTRVLPRYFRGSGRIAMSLTGGLDGRMIMAFARRGPGELPCYTFSSKYRESRDVEIARRVAKHCGQPHQTIVAGRQFLSQFPTLAEQAVYVSDGTMDVTGAAELYVNRSAREIAPVRLTGNYGSEILRGFVAFRPRVLDQALFDPEFARLVGAVGETYRAEREGDRLSFIAFKQVPWHHYSRFSVEKNEVRPRSPYLDNDLVALVYRAPPHCVATAELALQMIAEGDRDLAMIATDRGLTYGAPSFIGNICHLYQELTARLEYAYDYGMPQWLAKLDHLMAWLHFERLVLGRHKFSHFRIWYRDQLSAYLKEMLLSERVRNREYFRPGTIEKMVRKHISGHGNYTLEISRALTLELIHRQLIEQS